MKNENEKEIKKQVPEKNKKDIFHKGFFRKMWYSIVKIEKYPELATEGVPRTIGYLAKLVAILSIVICLGMVYQVHQELQAAISYIDTSFPNFTYADNSLQVEQEDVIVITNEEDSFTKVIVDTKTEDQGKINEYRDEMNEEGNGILILKDKVIIKNPSFTGTLTYSYPEILETIGITNFTKQDVISYAHSAKMITNVYMTFFIVIFIYSFIIYFLNTIASVLFISIFGYFTGILNRMKLRYAAIFNMAVYSITLSTILNMIYVIINVFTNFNIQYFDVMYLSVSVIYLIAAVFILKADLIKKQGELIRIQEVQKEVKEELERQEEEKKRQEREKERQNKKPKEKEEKDSEKKDKKKKEGDSGVSPEPEGSNA